MSVWLRSLLALTITLTALHWLVRTAPVRFANSDDVLYQQKTDARETAAFADQFAQEQGRFYYATPLYRQNWRIYEIRNAWAFAAVRTGFLLLQFGLLAGLVARLTASRETGWLVLLLGLGALHLPTTYYAALSYPAKWFGCCALLGSLHLQFTALTTGSRRAALGSGLLLLLSALCLELFVCYLPVFALLAWWQKKNVTAALRALAPQLAAVTAYVAVYLLFVRIHPSHYDGTQVSFSPAAAAQTLLRQTVSVVPGFELIIRRTQTIAPGPWHKSVADIGSALAMTPWCDYALALLQGVTVWLLARRLPAPAQPPRFMLAAVAGCVLVPNLLISLTARHQAWVFHRQLPYIYGIYAYAALVVAAVLGYQVAARHSANSHARLWPGLAATVSLAALVSAKVSNYGNLTLLHAWFN